MCDQSTGMFSLDALLCDEDAPLVAQLPEHKLMYIEDNKQAAAEKKARKKKKKTKKAATTRKKKSRRDTSTGELAPVPSQTPRTDIGLIKALTGSDKPESALNARFSKLASSRGAKQLPADLEGTTVERPPITPLERQVEIHINGAHLLEESPLAQSIGDIQLAAARKRDEAIAREAEGDAFNPRMPITTPTSSTPPASSGKRTRARTKKATKPNDEQARVIFKYEEEEDVRQGRRIETSESASARIDLINASAAPLTAPLVLTNDVPVDNLPVETMAHYRATTGCSERTIGDRWMEENLQAAEKREHDIALKQPPLTRNAKFMTSVQETIPFWKGVHTYMAVNDKQLPVTEIITREFMDTLLRQADTSRGERPCKLGTACEAFRHYGIILRERLRQTEVIRFSNARLVDPETAKDYLPNIQRMCIVCALYHVNFEYMKRLNKKEHTDDATDAPNGRSETYDDTSMLCDFQFDVTEYGQYDIHKCVGVGDTEFMGLPGPVLQWHPKYFIPVKVPRLTMSKKDRSLTERNLRKKTARREQTPRVVPHTQAWQHRGSDMAEAPVAVFKTPNRTPVPGNQVSEPQFATTATAFVGNQSNAVEEFTFILRQSDELLFRDGVMPVRVESESSSPSTLTSCN